MAGVRAEYGPSLPGLVRGRFGVAERTTRRALLALLVLAVAVTALLVARHRAGVGQLVHRGDPTFNLVYARGDLRPAPPRPGELVRLQAARRGLRFALVARPLALPPYAGVAASGLLPVVADRRLAQLRARFADLRLRDEGKARVGNARGYAIDFRTGPPDRRTFGQDVLLVPDAIDAPDPNVRTGLVVSLRQTGRRGRLGPRDQRLARLVKKALRSLRFGTGRD